MALELASSVRTASHERRLAEVVRRMEEANVDRLIAYGWGTHSYLDFNPAWYLSGFKQLGANCAAVVSADGEAYLVVEPLWDAARAVRSSVMPVMASNDVLGTLRRLACDGGWNSERLAVAHGDDPWLSARDRWVPVLGCEPAAGTKLVTDVAQVRDTWSMQLISEAVAIAERSYEHALSIARPGLPEHQLHAEVELCARELGADDNFLLLSASQHNYCVHQATNRTLEVGDIVLAEISPSVQGEFVQICRTFVVGREPSAAEQAGFDLLCASFSEGLRAALPGAAAGDVVLAMNRPLIDAGYERYTRPPYMRVRGHANGLGPAIPELAPDSPTELLEGMTFEMHPNQYLPETGYLMCGEPVVVEASGARALTSRMGTLDRC